MKTNMEMIRELDEIFTPELKHVISMSEIYLVNEKLCLDDMNKIALFNLYDMVVMYYSAKVDSIPETETRKRLDIMDKMSAINCVINLKLRNISKVA